MLSRPLMTTHEVAELLKVKEATVRKWIRDGELPAIQFHREWRVAVRHLEEFVEARLTPVRPKEASAAGDAGREPSGAAEDVSDKRHRGNGRKRHPEDPA